MKSIRLIPIVLVAVTALFLLKGIGLLTQGGYLLVGTSPARAQEQPQSQVPAAEDTSTPELTNSEIAAAERAAETLFAQDPSQSGDAETGAGAAESDAGVDPANSDDTDATNSEAGVSADNERNFTSPTEQAVLLRLRERRVELDAREGELDLRVSLVEAAEARLNERIASLAAVEARVQALVDKNDAQGDQQFSALVSMYENMKSGEAASVFNTLNMDVLLRLAINMNPRKMSPILADMRTERAQELTVRLATAEKDATQLAITAPVTRTETELPQIIGQ